MPRAHVARSPRHVINYRPVLRTIKALVFPAGRRSHVMRDLPTLANPSGPQRFPCIEAVFGTPAYAHDCIVEVTDHAGVLHEFMVSCQQGQDLLNNRAVRSILPANLDVWRGSIAVLKMGQLRNFVGLPNHQKALAVEALKAFFRACGHDDPDPAAYLCGHAVPRFLPVHVETRLF